MKKLIVILVALFIGFIANGQIVRKTERVVNGHTIERNEFHLGDYVFKGSTIFDGKEDYPHNYSSDFDIDVRSDEIKTVYNTILNNKAEIEAKYGVYIAKILPNFTQYGRIYSIDLVLYSSVEEYNAVMAQKENQKENEKNDRLNSIL